MQTLDDVYKVIDAIRDSWPVQRKYLNGDTEHDFVDVDVESPDQLNFCSYEWRVKPYEHTVYMNVYADETEVLKVDCKLYTTREYADQGVWRDNRRVSCLRIEFAEGQFDD